MFERARQHYQLLETSTIMFTATKALILALAAAQFTSSTDVDEYDYVIVGSGPGGGSLA